MRTNPFPFGRLLPALGLAALGCAAAASTAPREANAAPSGGPTADASCAGLATEVRQTSLFAQSGSIAAVTPLVGKWQSANRKVSFTRPAGAAVVLRAQPAMTAPWLERVATCHAAQYASAADAPTWDPLVPPGARVRVVPVETGYSVEITSDDPEVAKEILRRAKAALAR